MLFRKILWEKLVETIVGTPFLQEQYQLHTLHNYHNYNLLEDHNFPFPRNV
jgi:hypothetical protein